VTTAETASLLAAKIRDVPDYPKPGVMFKDITPLLDDANAFSALVQELAGRAQAWGATKVVGLEARGFILAAPAAYAAGAGFVPVRKAGKLPGPVYGESYALEYGEAVLEVQQEAFTPGDRVLIVDDVLATGGTLAATTRLLTTAGAVVTGAAVVLELSALKGRDLLEPLPVTSLHTV
jgi:adenine phosphoribosyltransferase